MTQREKDILNKLSELKAYGGNLLGVTFEDEECGIFNETWSFVKIMAGKIHIFLRRPLKDEHLTQWESAISEAHNLLDKRYNAIEHEKNHPDIFEAAKALIKYL